MNEVMWSGVSGKVCVTLMGLVSVEVATRGVNVCGSVIASSGDEDSGVRRYVCL